MAHPPPSLQSTACRFSSAAVARVFNTSMTRGPDASCRSEVQAWAADRGKRDAAARSPNHVAMTCGCVVDYVSTMDVQCGNTQLHSTLRNSCCCSREVMGQQPRKACMLQDDVQCGAQPFIQLTCQYLFVYVFAIELGV